MSLSTRHQPLDPNTRRAGAVVMRCGEEPVVAHYGSPAGELAVCLRNVGLADRSDLGKFVVTGTAVDVAMLVRRLTGATLTPSGVAGWAGTWFCAAGPDKVLVLAEPARRSPVLEMLRTAARPWARLNVIDASAQLSAMAILGRYTLDVLRHMNALGPEEDPRTAPPFASIRLDDTECALLLESDRRALLVVAAEDASHVWRSVGAAGRTFGMSCVGKQAVDRVALLDRMTGGPATLT